MVHRIGQGGALEALTFAVGPGDFDCVDQLARAQALCKYVVLRKLMRQLR